jgi:hypothetical protein
MTKLYIWRHIHCNDIHGPSHIRIGRTYNDFAPKCEIVQFLDLIVSMAITT